MPSPGRSERQFRLLRARTGQVPLLLISGGAAVKLAAITDLPFGDGRHALSLTA